MITHTSATRTSAETQQHVGLVVMMAKYYAEQGYTNIRADIPGYQQPDTITDKTGNRYIPDLTCNKNDQSRTRVILEAETCGTINDSHTAGQWKAFYCATGMFHVVVPKACGSQSGRDKAKARLVELGISAEQIWTPQ